MPLIETAERYGFDAISMGNGYPTAPDHGHTPAPFLILASLAPRTGMRLGTGVTLVPTWHPLKLAYDAAVLDQITGGRFFLGVGLGGPPLARRFGVDPERVGEYLDDTLAALRALWAGADGFKGKYFSVQGSVGVRPIQAGGLPIWVGGGIRRSVERAAEWGNAYIASTSPPFAQVARQAARYREALAKRGKDPSAAVVSANRMILVHENPEEAQRLAEVHLGKVLHWYARRRNSAAATKTTAEIFREEGPDASLFGSPDQVVAQAQRYIEAGVTRIEARIVPHDAPIEVALRTVELLGKEVLPQLK
jgi:alkanesulfonate monooxygenase SsuD/methylene tetrahydromethanopterin reductase-like flavin-dependent oxidoreductase (luciferase family)